jgi:hypothetical protein
MVRINPPHGRNTQPRRILSRENLERTFLVAIRGVSERSSPTSSNAIAAEQTAAPCDLSTICWDCQLEALIAVAPSRPGHEQARSAIGWQRVRAARGRCMDGRNPWRSLARPRAALESILPNFQRTFVSERLWGVIHHFGSLQNGTVALLFASEDRSAQVNF